MTKRFTVRQVAEQYEVNPNTVYGWVKDGLLGSLRLPGGDIRIRQEDIDAFEARQWDAPSLNGQIIDLSAVRRGSGSSNGPKTVSLDPIQRARATRRKLVSSPTNG